MALKRELTVGERKITKTYGRRDQFAPELLYFSECVLKDREPEPSGWEGLADVRTVAVLYRSARTGKAAKIRPIRKTTRPTMKQEIHRAAVREPRLVKTRPPSR